MSRSGACGFVIGFVSILVLVQKPAHALATTPPGGSYPYQYREGMVASTSITLTDPMLNADGFSRATVQSNADGNAVTVTSYPYDLGYLTPIDYYSYLPNVLASGAPDTSWVQFDLKDGTGEFAGFNYTYSWVDGGVTWYYFYQEVNMEGHSVRFSVDGAGNVDESTVTQTRARQRPDRCKILSDWGAFQCSANTGEIREIPTQVSSFLWRIGWFDSAMSWTWSHLQSAYDATSAFIADPRVQLILIIAATVAADAACCGGTAGTACAWCIVSGLAVSTAAAGNYIYTQNNVPTITNTSSQLRAAGVISCSGSGCNNPVTCGCNNPWSCSGTPAVSGCGWICKYSTTQAACQDPWYWDPSTDGSPTGTCFAVFPCGSARHHTF